MNDEDKDLEQLLADVGVRPEPSDAAKQHAYAALRSEWRDKIDSELRKKNRRNLSMLSAAAAVLVTTAITFFWLPADHATWQVRLASGTVSLDEQRYNTEQTLNVLAEQTFTAHTPVRIETDTGTDVRLAAGSIFRWIDGQTAYLQAGNVYIDTKDRSDFAVHTPFGKVRDIGTRYMVTLGELHMDVAVREGSAELESAFGRHTAIAKGLNASLMHIDRSGVREAIEPTSDQRWHWIHSVSAGYAQRNVPAVLTAIARDLGKRMLFENHGVEATVANETVQGDLANLDPYQALELVTRSAGLTWQEQADTISINFNQ